MVMTDKDKMIAALAVGLLVVTVLASTNALLVYQRFGARPLVQITEFRVDYGAFCDGKLGISFVLTNTGRDGFAQVEVREDEKSLLTNNYRIGRDESRLITESVVLFDCTTHSFRADITATWT